MMRVISLLVFVGLAAGQSDPLVEGLEAFHRGDYPSAERHLRESLSKNEDPRARAFLAMTLAATSRCKEAIPVLRTAVETSDAGAKDIRRLAGLALAQCHMSANQFGLATAVVTKLKVDHPADADVLYQAARLHMRAWNDTLQQMYRNNPSSFRVNQISGEILEMQGMFNEAVAEYRKAIAKNPNALNLHFRLGRALLMSSQTPETMDAALKEFEAELAKNPHDAVAHYQVAQILEARQKPAEAARRFASALELQPDFPEALIALGKLRSATKKHDEAIPLLERAVKLLPRSETAHYALMIAYRDAGRMQDALREKAELDKLQKPPEGEFTEFLKKLGEKPGK